MDNEHYLDLMASAALNGILSTNEGLQVKFNELAVDCQDIAEAMWEEREKRRAARAALEKKDD